jgi:hypothetical protein
MYILDFVEYAQVTMILSVVPIVINSPTNPTPAEGGVKAL